MCGALAATVKKPVGVKKAGHTEVDSARLESLLLPRVADLQDHIAAAIPQRFRSLIAPEDVLQDVWIAARQALPEVVRDPDGWLRKVANTKLIDALRCARSVKRGGNLAPLRPVEIIRASYARLFARTHGRTKTPSRDVSTDEQRDALQVALAGLLPDSRRVLQLCWIDHLTRKQIARQMRRSESAVNSLLYRAMRQLKRVLGDAAKYFTHVRTGDGRAR